MLGQRGGCWGVLDPASPWVPAVLELQVHNHRQDVCSLDAFVGYLWIQAQLNKHDHYLPSLTGQISYFGACGALSWRCEWLRGCSSLPPPCQVAWLWWVL